MQLDISQSHLGYTAADFGEKVSRKPTEQFDCRHFRNARAYFGIFSRLDWGGLFLRTPLIFIISFGSWYNIMVLCGKLSVSRKCSFIESKSMS